MPISRYVRTRLLLVAACVAIFATAALIQPRYPIARLPAGRELRMPPPPPTLRPVGAPATVLSYITDAPSTAAVEREIREEILPVLIANAAQFGDTIILIQARRPVIDVGILARVTSDVYLRFDRQAGEWRNVPFRVPGR